MLTNNAAALMDFEHVAERREQSGNCASGEISYVKFSALNFSPRRKHGVFRRTRAHYLYNSPGVSREQWPAVISSRAQCIRRWVSLYTATYINTDGGSFDFTSVITCATPIRAQKFERSSRRSILRNFARRVSLVRIYGPPREDCRLDVIIPRLYIRRSAIIDARDMISKS